MNPMSRKRYLSWPIAAQILFAFKESYLKTRKQEKKNKIDPWPISPNIIPKKNGKVMMVNIAGLAS